jgi:hypothetical protein
MSGWFRDRSVVVDPGNGPVEKRLVSFVHYSDDIAMYDDDVVLIRVGNLYIQYNRAKMYNVDADVPNTVTITYAKSNDDVSDRVAALAEGELFLYSNYENGRTLTIQVCSMVQYESTQLDFSIVRIYLDDEMRDQSICNIEYIPHTAVPYDGAETSTDDNLASTAPGNNSTSIKRNDPIVDLDDSGVTPSTKIQSSVGDDNSKEDIVRLTIIMAVSSISAFLVTFIGSFYVATRFCRRKDPESCAAPNQNLNSTVKSNMDGKDSLDETTKIHDDPIWSSTTDLYEI